MMKKKRVAVVESLGWLTESTIMPKKHRAIAGVGPSSIFELKAELYKSQEDSKRSKDQQQLPTTDHHLDYHRAKKKITSRDPLSLKNSGVDARSLKYDALLLAFLSTLYSISSSWVDWTWILVVDTRVCADQGFFLGNQFLFWASVEVEFGWLGSGFPIHKNNTFTIQIWTVRADCKDWTWILVVDTLVSPDQGFFLFHKLGLDNRFCFTASVQFEFGRLGFVQNQDVYLRTFKDFQQKTSLG